MSMSKPTEKIAACDLFVEASAWIDPAREISDLQGLDTLNEEWAKSGLLVSPIIRVLDANVLLDDDETPHRNPNGVVMVTLVVEAKSRSKAEKIELPVALLDVVSARLDPEVDKTRMKPWRVNYADGPYDPHEAMEND